MLQAVLAFIARHKKKFIALVLTGALGAGAYWYFKKLLKDSLVQLQQQRTKLKVRQRKEAELARLQDECQTTILTFLPPLRRQLNRLTDPRPVTMQLKELRAKQKQRARDQWSKDDEALMDRLWEDLKILSLARLAASVYSLTLMDLLLRVQLHVAARVDIEEGSEIVNQQVREQFMLKAVDFFVGKGLNTLLERVTSGIRQATKVWAMGTEATVTRAEIMDMVNNIRKEVEDAGGSNGATAGLSRNAHAWFLKCIIQPDEALARAKSDAGLSGVHATGLKAMLDETMDLLESPHFAQVLELALSRIFTVLLDELYARQFEGVRKPAAVAATAAAATVTPVHAGAAAPAPAHERFILAKVIVGMKLVASDVLATGESDDAVDDAKPEADAAPAAAAAAAAAASSASSSSSSGAAANKYVRELEALPALQDFCKTVIGLGDDEGDGMDGIGAEDMKALSGLLAALGGGGAAGGAAEGEPNLQGLLQALGGAGDVSGLLPRTPSTPQQGAPRITRLD